MINSVTASKYFLDNLEKGRFLVLLFRWTASVCEGLLPMQLSCHTKQFTEQCCTEGFRVTILKLEKKTKPDEAVLENIGLDIRIISPQSASHRTQSQWANPAAKMIHHQHDWYSFLDSCACAVPDDAL